MGALAFDTLSAMLLASNVSDAGSSYVCLVQSGNFCAREEREDDDAVVKLRVVNGRFFSVSDAPSQAFPPLEESSGLFALGSEADEPLG